MSVRRKLFFSCTVTMMLHEENKSIAVSVSPAGCLFPSKLNKLCGTKHGEQHNDRQTYLGLYEVETKSVLLIFTTFMFILSARAVPRFLSLIKSNILLSGGLQAVRTDECDHAAVCSSTFCRRAQVI